MHSETSFQLPEALADVATEELVLLLDCDGVLAPIVDDPLLQKPYRLEKLASTVTSVLQTREASQRHDH